MERRVLASLAWPKCRWLVAPLKLGAREQALRPLEPQPTWLPAAPRVPSLGLLAVKQRLRCGPSTPLLALRLPPAWRPAAWRPQAGPADLASLRVRQVLEPQACLPHARAHLRPTHVERPLL